MTSKMAVRWRCGSTIASIMRLINILIVNVTATSSPTSNCPPMHFECDNKRCIPQSYQCDKEQDCDDGTDELGCSKLELFFCIFVILLFSYKMLRYNIVHKFNLNNLLLSFPPIFPSPQVNETAVYQKRNLKYHLLCLNRFLFCLFL